MYVCARAKCVDIKLIAVAAARGKPPKSIQIQFDMYYL